MHLCMWAWNEFDIYFGWAQFACSESFFEWQAICAKDVNELDEMRIEGKTQRRRYDQNGIEFHNKEQFVKDQSVFKYILGIESIPLTKLHVGKKNHGL